MDWHDHISVDSSVRSGKPCIKGTRITVYDVLKYLAGGMSEEEILADFPDLTLADIRACLGFAAARERSFTEGFPPKVIWLDVGNAGTTKIAKLLRRERRRIARFATHPNKLLASFITTATDIYLRLKT